MENLSYFWVNHIIQIIVFQIDIAELPLIIYFAFYGLTDKVSTKLYVTPFLNFITEICGRNFAKL